MMALIVSGMPIGGLVGGLLAGLIADRVGRKKCMLLNNIPVAIGTVLMALGWDVNTFIIGRIILGFACGVATGVAPMYIAEISPVSVKGAVGVSHQFMITFGILIGFILSIKPLLGWFDSYWHVYFAFPVLPMLYQVILLPFCPESPNWLYYNKNREDLATNALVKLRNSETVAEKELAEMIKERTSAHNEDTDAVVSYGTLFTNKTLRLSLLIGVVLQCAQQLSGVNAILNYAPSIFADAGQNNADLATGLMGGINVIMTFISVPLMDRLGRRTLMLGGLCFMTLSYVGLGAAQVVHSNDPTHASWTSLVSMLTIILFLISFAIGPGSIPWLIVAEIFTAEARGKASSICVGANWICNLLVCITYSKLNEALQPYTFFLYMGVVLVSFIFTLLFVPETRQKPVEQINREIREQSLKFPPFVTF